MNLFVVILILFRLGLNSQGFNLVLRDNVDYDGEIARMRAWGATDVALVVVCYQSKTSLDCDLSDVRDAIRVAKNNNLRVWLKPHIETTEFSWRGEITFETSTEWRLWWKNYRRMLYPLADFKPDVLVIGTELNGMIQRENAWRRLSYGARHRCGCEVLYASNWDVVSEIRWWDAVDKIGVDAYFPLASDSSDVDSLVRAWQPHVVELENLSRRWGKKIVFTEIGYQSRVGSYLTPYQKDPAIISEQDQANAYRATIRVFGDKSWWAGAMWWEWNVDDDGTGFTPIGKKAESVLREWWGLH